MTRKPPEPSKTKKRTGFSKIRSLRLGTKIQKTSLRKPRLYLLRRESIGTGLQAIASLQLEWAIAGLKGNNVSPQAIHHARTTIKKVRAIIELAVPCFTRGQRSELTATLRDAASRIAPLRDTEVLLNTFDLLLDKTTEPQDNCTSLRDGLVDQARQCKSNGSRQIPHVIRLLKRIHQSIPEWSLCKLTGQDLRRRIQRTYRRGRITLDHSATSGDEEQFHTWRKLVKLLWYQLRLTSRHWPDDARDLIMEIGAIGESAGTERDLILLSHWLGNGPKTPSSNLLQGTLASLLPQLRKQAISAGNTFYREKPRQFVSTLDL
jgi:CHAD domain-containing protein